MTIHKQAIAEARRLIGKESPCSKIGRNRRRNLRAKIVRVIEKYWSKGFSDGFDWCRNRIDNLEK